MVPDKVVVQLFCNMQRGNIYSKVKNNTEQTTYIRYSLFTIA